MTKGQIYDLDYYFSWSNQTLAMLSLWIATTYFIKRGGNRYDAFITAVPATFMSAVSSTYILMADEGFGLPAGVAYPAGAVFAASHFIFFIAMLLKYDPELKGVTLY